MEDPISLGMEVVPDALCPHEPHSVQDMAQWSTPDMFDQQIDEFASQSTLMRTFESHPGDFKLQGTDHTDSHGLYILESEAAASKSYGCCDGENKHHALQEFREEMEMRLFCLSALGDLQGIKNLIEDGVDINAKDYNGRTALHWSAERGRQDVVSFLLNVGANIHCKDDRGLSPLALAKDSKYFALQNAFQQASERTTANHTAELNRAWNIANFAIMEAFPLPIAQAILEGRSIEPVSKDKASLLFLDIVSFTTISSSMNSKQVSRMLNRFFSKLDTLAHRHGVQKIDIVGDSYVAATNFTEDQSSDHAARLARFAIDATKAALTTRIDDDDPDKCDCVRIRVGLHCGAVSGSVVGWKSFKYTLIGDTVNTASKMESTCIPGRIQCSDVMAALIAEQAHDMVLIPRRGRPPSNRTPPTFWLSTARDRLRSSCPDLPFLVPEQSMPVRTSKLHQGRARAASCYEFFGGPSLSKWRSAPY